jgi:dihydroorotase
VSERLLIKGGDVFEPGWGVRAGFDVLMVDGVIHSVGPKLAADGASVIDAHGCIVAPGFVDLHAHLREPGFEQKGTIATETLAALRGGFTTICAMPNTEPPPDNASTVEALLGLITRAAHVRVLPIGCVTRGRDGKVMAELSEMAAAGVVAFSDDGNPVADGRLMRNALALAAALGLPISEHSDDPVLNAGGSMNEGRVSERLGLPGQPAAAEITAIARNITLAESVGAHIHIAHVSTSEGVQLVRDAKARGTRVTCEVTPSHLFFTESAVFGDQPQPAYDTNAKINPPLRTEKDRLALLAGINDGTIDAIATDHAPHAIEDKLCEFDHAAPGISCFETALGTVCELVHRGELDLTRALDALTAGPVSAFGLANRYPGMGKLLPGVSGDILVFDPNATERVNTQAFASKGRNTPLNGMELHGVVRNVIFDGQLAYSVEVAHV